MQCLTHPHENSGPFRSLESLHETSCRINSGNRRCGDIQSSRSTPSWRVSTSFLCSIPSCLLISEEGLGGSLPILILPSRAISWSISYVVTAPFRQTVARCIATIIKSVKPVRPSVDCTGGCLLSCWLNLGSAVRLAF